MSAWAQVEQSNLMLGGNLGFSATKTKIPRNYSSGFYEQKSTTLFLSPNVGYFILDQLAVGADCSFNFSNYSIDGSDYAGKSTAFAPFATVK